MKRMELLKLGGSDTIPNQVDSSRNLFGIFESFLESLESQEISTRIIIPIPSKTSYCDHAIVKINCNRETC